MVAATDALGLFRSLGRLSNNILQSESYDELLRNARDEIDAMLGFGHVWIYLSKGGDDSEYQLLSLSGDIDEVALQVVSQLEMNSDPFLAEILAAKELVYVEDARIDPRTNKDIVALVGNRTIVNCPITLYGQTLGCIGAGSFNDDGVRPLTTIKKEYFMALTNVLAVAIDRVHLIDISSVDHLTGLHNRRSLLERGGIALMQAQRHQRSLGLIYIDMNDFKPINDAYGHTVGDELLRSFAACIKANVRTSDIVARIGGDEFVIILSELNSDDEMNHVIKYLRDNCCLPEALKQLTLSYNYSVGMALFPDDGNNIEALLDVADKRMYLDKQQVKEGRQYSEEVKS